MTPQDLEKGIQFLKKAKEIVYLNADIPGGGTDSFMEKYHPGCEVITENIEWFKPIISFMGGIYIKKMEKGYLELTIWKYIG